MITNDLTGRLAFVAGVADDQGFGWAIAKRLCEAGATVVVGCWPPLYQSFTTALQLGKFADSQQLADGSMMNFAAIYPFDAAYDRPEEVPQEVRENKRYQKLSNYTVSEVAARLTAEFGPVDYVVHSLANAPEVQKPLLETSRSGYLAALNSSSYSLIALVQQFAPHMREGGAFLTLSYLASTRVVPGYGGGMSSAKAALEADVRVLAWEIGRKYGLRINCLSPGPYRSRAGRAIGHDASNRTFIDKMIDYAQHNGPLQEPLLGKEVADGALYLLSPFARAITGAVLPIDKGLSIMGVAPDSPTLS